MLGHSGEVKVADWAAGEKSREQIARIISYKLIIIVAVRRLSMGLISRVAPTEQSAASHSSSAVTFNPVVPIDHPADYPESGAFRLAARFACGSSGVGHNPVVKCALMLQIHLCP